MVLLGVDRHIIRATCGSKLFDRVSTDVLKERLGVVVKIEDILVDSCLHGVVMSSMETKITNTWSHGAGDCREKEK